MPPLIFAALAGAGLYAGYKWLAKEQESARENLRRAAEKLNPNHQAQPKTARTRQSAAKSIHSLEGVKLVRDPKTGVYKPES